MKFSMVTEQEVKRANRLFYDIVADVYEEVDGRRSEDLLHWIENNLRKIGEQTKCDSLLDLGCGTGIVLRAAKKIFKNIYGLDISLNILKNVSNSNGLVCGEVTSLPFKNESFNAVTLFAVLHHIYDPKPVFREIWRVLKKGGMLYIDHDLEANFVKRFGWLVLVYRFLFDPGRRYLAVKKELTRDLFESAEAHSGGVDPVGIMEELRKIGFGKMRWYYHWFGLNKISNWIIGDKKFQKGSAPLFTLFARK